MTDEQKPDHAFARSRSNVGLDIALKKALRKSCKVIVSPSDVMLDIAMQTLRQIATTPRNKGARISANATLRFIETQMSNV